MSIEDSDIEEAKRAGQLVVVPPLDPTGAHQRVILATPKLMESIANPPHDVRRRFIIELRADLDRFIMGAEISVGGQWDDSYMKQMGRWKNENGFNQEEVWEIRSVDPKPSIRVFGRFAKFDVFVATDWEFRTLLGAFGSIFWKREIRRCKSDWRKIFDTRDPHHGVTVHDYISDPVIDLRDS